MSLKNFTILKILTVCCAFLLFSVGLNAQTVTKVSNPSVTTSIDGTGGAYVDVNAPIAFTQTDFSQGCGVTDVNIRIRWAKTDGSCTSPLTGSSFHGEAAFRLVAPDGTTVDIFDPGTYTGNATMSLITQTFDESSGSNPGGATPTGGTYNPEGDFNLFNGTNGLGTWRLQGRDTGGGDPLCVDWWEITVSTTTDNTAPTAVCTSITRVLDGSGTASITASDIENGSSDLCGVNIASISVSPSTFTCADIGLNSVTLTIEDVYGNVGTCGGFVTIEDNQAPTITCPGDVSVNVDGGSCSASGVALGTPTTSDNCSVTTSNDAPGSFPLGTTVVTWTVEDGDGNTATCTQNVTVTDNEAPTISCPGPISISTSSGECFALGASLGTPTTMDNCGVASVTNDAPTSFPLGSTTVTWTVTDDAGLTATCTQTVLVQDGENPAINCGSAVTIPMDAGFCTASSAGLTPPPAVDNCTVISVTNNAPANLVEGNNLIQWTAVDAQGNSAQCTQTIVVEDQEAPTITCPADVMWDANFNGCVYLGANLGTPTTMDNCGVASVTNDAPAGSFPEGTTMVTWTVTDDAGNSATCTQNVTIMGGSTLSAVPTDQTCGASNGSIDLTVSGTAVMPNGNYMWSDGQTVEDPMGLAPGTYSVTVTNTHGCTVTGSFTVGDVVDVTPPTITCPADINTSANDPACTEASGVALGTPTTSDDCNVASTTNDAPATFPVGTTTVTWTVTDDAGNSTTCAQMVTVTATCDILVMPKVFLEGAYNGTDMNDQLRAGNFIPMGEPYTGLGYTHAGPGGGEMTTGPVLAVTGSDAIVDWVIVELRDAADASIVVATRAALVQKDGDVVDVDGVSAVAFSGVADGNYNVAIRHRNHLGAMTMNAMALSSTPAMVDFTDAATMTFGTDAQKDISGVMCLHAGNVGGDGFTRATGPGFINDASQILSRLVTFTTVVTGTYENEDVNMDGNIRATGPAFINDSSQLLNYLGTFTTVRQEQLP